MISTLQSGRSHAQRHGHLRLGPDICLGMVLALSLAGCHSLAYLDDPASDGGAGDGASGDGGARDGGGSDGSIGRCPGPNPSGCVSRGCAAGEVCDLRVSRCLPSDCFCDARTGGWECTDDCGGGLCRPTHPDGEITFTLNFESDTPDADQLYVQASDSSGGPAWIEVVDLAGQTIRTQAICSTCACSACGESCPVCGAAPEIVEKVLPGGSVSTTWDAVTHPLDMCSDGFSCWDSQPLAHGDYLARFCYSATADGEGVGHRIGTPVLCDEIPFAWLGQRLSVEDPICWCG